MQQRTVRHSFKIMLALAALACGGATASAQQGPVRTVHGAWNLMCDKQPGSEAEQCVVLQSVVPEDDPQLPMTVALLKTPDKKSVLLRVLLPLGVLLPNELGLYVDQADMGRVKFEKCTADGCQVQAILSQNISDAFLKGKQATFTVFKTPEQGIGIPISLEGFAEAFSALP